MKVCTNIQSDDCICQLIVRYQKTIVKVHTVKLRLMKAQTLIHQIGNFMDPFTPGPRCNKDSDDKCYDTIVSFMPGPDADTRNILITNIMIQLSHSCRGPDAETGQPMH